MPGKADELLISRCIRIHDQVMRRGVDLQPIEDDKKCCVNCHFLIHSAPPVSPGGPPFSEFWTKDRRQRIEPHPDLVSQCAHGVWSNGIDRKINVREEVVKDRKGTGCPFIEFQPGITTTRSLSED